MNTFLYAAILAMFIILAAYILTYSHYILEILKSMMSGLQKLGKYLVSPSKEKPKLVNKFQTYTDYRHTNMKGRLSYVNFHK